MRGRGHHRRAGRGTLPEAFTAFGKTGGAQVLLSVFAFSRAPPQRAQDQGRA